jgi:hypothetical protein
MSGPQTSQVSASERLVRRLALAVAAVDGLVIPMARLTHFFGPAVLRAVTIGSAGLLALLFVQMLFDPATHRAVNEANRELQGDQLFSWRWRRPIFDPTWGVFGSRLGLGYLTLVRTALLAEFVVCVVVSAMPGNSGSPPLLAAAAFGITIVLTLGQLKDHAPATETGPPTPKP